MKLIEMKNRELLDLAIVLIGAIIFSAFNVSINFTDKLFRFFSIYASGPTTQLHINIIFLSLTVLLWLTYGRWKGVAKEQVGLANVIGSISPDVLTVVDSDRNIIMCNASVKRMFGYEVDEVINQKTDMLYFDRRSNPNQPHEIFDMLEMEGFHIGLATGKKKNGETIPLEIITGNLSGRLGAVLLLRDITERKQAEETLRESEERFRHISASAQDGIIMMDNEGNISYWNEAAKKIFGYTKEEAVGKEVHIFLGPERYHEAYRKGFSRFKETGQGAVVGKTLALSAIRKDRTEFPIELSVSAVKIKGKWHSIGIVRDITDRKWAEEQIKASLKEKDVLLKEIHHRVRNNLQVIFSLLSLQSGYIKDKQVLEMFKESQNRIRAMALIHERLYQSESLTKIDCAEYIRNLVANLFRSYGVNSEAITMKLNVDDASLNIDMGIPCGLIINELVSNSIRYAFPTDGTGEIRIDFRSDNQNEYTLVVSDNGVGLPKDLDFRNTESLGLQLVKTLTDQLEGTIELDRRSGTVFTITFPS